MTWAKQATLSQQNSIVSSPTFKILRLVDLWHKKWVSHFRTKSEVYEQLENRLEL